MSRTEPPTAGPGGTCDECGSLIPSGWSSCPSCAETELLGGVDSSVPTAGPARIGGYRIVRLLGKGGMGSVYEAVDEKMNRKVALKILEHRLAAPVKAQERFHREAWLGGRLNHPGLVRVFERGVWKECEYYSMELIDGGSLHDVIQAMKIAKRDDRWNLEFGGAAYMSWAIAKVAEAARALDYAHRHGVVHRDVKPMNILLTTDPCVVKVADFGIALDLDATRMTTEGSRLGSVAYMPPEQIKGEKAKMGPGCDIYSLGVTLFEMVTLELPHSGHTEQLYLNSVLTDPARRPSRLNEKVSRDLDIVLGKALEREPADRYATAAEFAADLENVLAFRPIDARPPSAGSKLVKWARRKPVHAAFAAALIVGVPVVGFLGVRSLRQERLLVRGRLDSLWVRALQLHQAQRPADAVGPLTEILEHDPENLKALRARSLSYLKLAIPETDGVERSRLARLALADATAAVGLSPGESWPWALRAHVHERLGDPEAAAVDAREADSRRSGDVTSEELNFEGLLARERGEYQRAVEILSEVIAREPRVVEARIDRALAYEEMGEIEPAITDYEVAAGLRAEDPWIRYRLARLLTAKGDLRAAEIQLREALKKDPDNPSFRTGLADTLLARGRARTADDDPLGAVASFMEAEKQAARAVELAPDMLWARLNLGASLMEQYRLADEPDPNLVARASAEYERVIALWRAGGSGVGEDEYLTTLVNQCDALIQIGEFHRALEVCRAAVDADPEDSVNYYNLAGVYALLGRPDEALEALERDVELGDTDWGYLENDGWFDSIRGRPKYADLVRRMRSAAGSQ